MGGPAAESPPPPPPPPPPPVEPPPPQPPPPPPPISQHMPAVAFDGENYLVAWTDNRLGQNGENIYGSRVTPSGIVLDQAGIPISVALDSQLDPTVAFDGANYLLAWTDERGPGNLSNIYAARVSPSGAVLEANGIPVSTAPGSEREPEVDFGARRLSRCLGGQPRDLSGPLWSPRDAGRDCARSKRDSDLHGPVSPVFDRRGVRRGPSPLRLEDVRAGTFYDIYGARVDPDGNVMRSGRSRSRLPSTPSSTPPSHSTGRTFSRSGATGARAATIWRSTGAHLAARSRARSKRVPHRDCGQSRQ